MTVGRHAIDALLDALAARGLPDGPDLRLRAYRALASGGPWHRTRIRTALRSIYAWDEASRAAFDKTFDKSMPEVEGPPEWLVERLSGRDPAVPWDAQRLAVELDRLAAEQSARRQSRSTTSPSRPSVATTRPVPRWRARIVNGAMVIAVVVTVCLNVAHRIGGPPPQTRPDDDATAQKDPGPVQQTRLPTPPPEPKVAGGPARTAAILVAGAALGALALAVWLVRRSSRVLPKPPVIETAEQEDERPTARAEPFRSTELRKIAYDVGLARDRDAPILDIIETVRATARSGGFFTPALAPGAALPRLWVVLATGIDPWARLLLDRVCDALRSVGVPLRFASERINPAPTDLVLAVVDAARLRRPISAAASAGGWLRHPHVAIIESRDPALWGPEIAARLHIAPFVLDAPGVSAALRAALAVRRNPPPRLRRVPPTLARLGDEVMPLAGACALAEPLNLAEIDELRREFFPRVPPLAVQRILALEGAIPDADAVHFVPELRADLIRRLPQETRQAVAEWQSKRLERQQVAPNTREALGRDREMALLGLAAAAWKVEGMAAAELELTRRHVAGVVEAHLATLERQLAHPALAKRVQERALTLAPSLRALRALGDGIAARLGRLGALKRAPRLGPWSAPHGLATRIAAGVLALLALAALAGAAWAASRPDICARDRTDCGGRCYAIDRDPANCGACGRACATGEACFDGACQCPAGSLCGDACVDLQTEDRHCGSCGRLCGAKETCTNGECAVPCPTPCGKACPDLTRDRKNCGSCGTTCADDEVCREGRCAKVDNCANRCGTECVDSFVDNYLHCGRCNNDCTQSVAHTGLCKGTYCMGCREGWLNCNLFGDDGCEIDTRDDPSNCGRCGRACPKDGIHTVAGCYDRECVGFCQLGWGDCTSDSGCETNLLVDPLHCGACDKTCETLANAVVACEAAQCKYACQEGHRDCTSVPGCETDIRTNLKHCGSCGNVCIPGMGPNGSSLEPTCANGVCNFSCSNFPGAKKCGQKCVDVQSDEFNCGDCGVVCSAGSGATASCVGGACQIACIDPARQPCSDKTCPDLSSDPKNCGACGAACPVAPSSQSSCVSGSCTPLVCIAGFSDCTSKPGCETMGPCGACGCEALLAECKSACGNGPEAKPPLFDRPDGPRVPDIPPASPQGGPDPACLGKCEADFFVCKKKCDKAMN